MTSYPPPGAAVPPPQGEPIAPSGYPPPMYPPSMYPPPPGAGFGRPGDPPRVSPPPPPIRPAAPVSAPPIAWLVPVAALFAVIGVFTPWFKPNGTVRGRSILNGDALYSWKEGRVGLIAPILLVILSITVLGLMRGKARGRFATGPNPVRSTAKWAIGAGVITLACLVIAWFLVPGQYHFTDGLTTYSWDELSSKGVAMGRGPQLGFWLTAVAAVLAAVGGAGMLATTSAAPAGAPAVSPAVSPAMYPTGQPGFQQPPPGGYPPPGSGPSLQKPPNG